MKQKTLIIIVAILFICSIAAPVIAAKITIGSVGGAFGNVFTKMSQFFAGGYVKFKKLIDFTLFFILFLSAFILAFGKFFADYPNKNAIIGVAVGLALMGSMVMVMKGIGIEMIFPWIKNFVYVILVVIIFQLLSNEKLLGGKSWFWRLLLAIIITWLMFVLGGSLVRGGGDIGSALSNPFSIFRPGAGPAPQLSQSPANAQAAFVEYKAREDKLAKQAQELAAAVSGGSTGKCGELKRLTVQKQQVCVERVFAQAEAYAVNEQHDNAVSEYNNIGKNIQSMCADTSLNGVLASKCNTQVGLELSAQDWNKISNRLTRELIAYSYILEKQGQTQQAIALLQPYSGAFYSQSSPHTNSATLGTKGTGGSANLPSGPAEYRSK